MLNDSIDIIYMNALKYNDTLIGIDRTNITLNLYTRKKICRYSSYDSDGIVVLYDFNCSNDLCNATVSEGNYTIECADNYHVYGNVNTESYLLNYRKS